MPDTATPNLALTLVEVGGSADTWGTKLNSNFSALDTVVSGHTNSIGTKLPSASYTAADVMAKVQTVDGAGSGLDADTVDGLHASAFALVGDVTAASLLGKLITVDGTGSGLDADLLDGLHASAFALAGHTHNYLPSDGGTISGTIIRASGGAHLYHVNAAYSSGRVFVTEAGAADPTSLVGDLWIELA